MANVCDYIKWRGDLDLEKSDFKCYNINERLCLDEGIFECELEMRSSTAIASRN